jgi:hypothetical protein
MLKQLAIKKEYLLIAGSIILLFLSYQLALKKTIEAWQINHRLNLQLTEANNLPYEPAYIERKNKNLNLIINQYKADTANFRSIIINTISMIADKQQVKLSEVPLQDPLYNSDAFIIQKLNFEGSYFALTKVLHQLQSASGIGMVCSVSYKAVGMRTTNDAAKKLILEVYLKAVK